MAREKSKKRALFHEKIKKREGKIRRLRTGKVDFSDNQIENTMRKYDVKKYKIEPWGDVLVNTGIGSWKITTDQEEEVVYLYHENEKLARVGNYRSSYHIHNVFYDLDYCVKSILEHDIYKAIWYQDST